MFGERRMAGLSPAVGDVRYQLAPRLSVHYAGGTALRTADRRRASPQRHNSCAHLPRAQVCHEQRHSAGHEVLHCQRRLRFRRGAHWHPSMSHDNLDTAIDYVCKTYSQSGTTADIRQNESVNRQRRLV